MAFMELQISAKGALYCADCRKCGATIYSHEWASWNNNELRDALQAGTAPCDQCCNGFANPDTFMSLGRQYAARYSADGYMDCADWNYGANKRKLLRDVREMYGE